jgi:hypothetical protein
MDCFRDEAEEIFPPSGTALFCACSADAVAIVDENTGTTMFTRALIDVLKTGDADLGERLTLAEVNSLVRARINELYGPDRVRPELYDPDQRKGDLSLIPCFPNAALYQQTVDVRLARLQSTIERLAVEQDRRWQPLSERLTKLETRVESQKATAADLGALKRLREVDLPEDVWQACPADVKSRYLQWRKARENGRVLIAVAVVLAIAAVLLLILNRTVLLESVYPLKFVVIILNTVMLLAIVSRTLLRRLAVLVSEGSSAQSAGVSEGDDARLKRTLWETNPTIITALREESVDFYGVFVSHGAVLISVFIALFTEFLAVANYVPALARPIS